MRQVERNALVERFLPFIEYVAREMHRRLPRFEYDDLVQIATLAFIEACDRSDPVAIDTPDEARMFRTYIGTRMRGAILDYVRRCFPKSLVRRYRLVSLDALAEGFDGDEIPEVAAPDDPLGEVLARLSRAEVLAALETPQQREIIDLHFYQGLKTGEIARRLNYHRCWTSRIKRDALDVLERKLCAA